MSTRQVMITEMKNKLYIPIMNGNITEDNRPKYLEILKSCGADAVFIAIDRELFYSDDRAPVLKSLCESIEFFRNGGISAGVWFQAFGFGTPLDERQLKLSGNWQHLVSVSGVTRPQNDAICPESEGFIGHYRKFVIELAKCRPDMMMLDDDLCQSVRPGLGCICPRHQELFKAAVKERGLAPITDDVKEWPQLIFTGEGNEYRRVFLDVMGRSLINFCRSVREAVDTVDDTMRIGFCAGYTSWDIEGVNAIDLTKVLAGDKTAPFLRLSSAPYWVAADFRRFPGQRLNTIIEFARAQEYWKRQLDDSVEIFNEADSYPRPRYNIPSSLIECFDIACRASGGMGSLKYLMDYYAPIENEMGYVKRHVRNLPLFDTIDEVFGGKETRGVYIYEPMEKFADMHLPETYAGDHVLMRNEFSPASSLLTAHAIPTSYDSGKDDCAAAFGYHAAYIDELPKKLIIDLPAAKLLKERGIDVGLISTEPQNGSPSFEYFTESCGVPAGRASMTNHSAPYEKCTIDKKAAVLSEFMYASGNIPSVYVYNNGSTEFFVLCVDSSLLLPVSSVFTSYGRQRQLLEFVGKVPHIKGMPGVYTLWKEDVNETALLFLNLYPDDMFDFDIELDSSYASVNLIGAEGVLDGDKIHITSTVAPYGIVIAVLKHE